MLDTSLPIAILDILPNPVMVKDDGLRYVWVNQAFEELFEISRDDLLGQTDQEFFTERQAVQCNGGDLRVLESGETDEAYETMVSSKGEQRDTLTRKSRLDQDDGSVLLVGVMHDITDVQLLADTDPLTGCLNRRALDQHMADAFASTDNAGGLLLMDLDRFKQVNDTWGHDAGDEALVHFVDIVNNLIGSDDRLARVGGEEFVVAVPGATSSEAAEMAERISKTLRSTPLDWQGHNIALTVSIGVIARSDDEPFMLAEWLPQADKCLYQAKDGGRDQVVVCSN